MSAVDALTIAIPTYNRCASVVSLAESIVPQLRSRDELLVIDDGSQDGTSEALGKIAGVRLLRNSSNRGMVVTWNACLQSASRDWICIIHDDDAIATTGIEAIRRACSAASDPALIAHHKVDTDLDACFRYRALEPGPWSVLNSSTPPSGATIHRAIVDTVGLFDERFAYSADIEYFARVSARFKLLIIESPQVVHCAVHDQNYRYKTWHEPDFLTQLEEIERLVIEYSGLRKGQAARESRLRMTGHVRHMFSCAACLGDKALLRRTGRLLYRMPGVERRLRLTACVAAALGWCP